MSMRCDKMAAPLGAVVTGLDVRKATSEQWTLINDHFLAHHVLVFPEQDLQPDDQVAFAQRWCE